MLLSFIPHFSYFTCLALVSGWCFEMNIHLLNIYPLKINFKMNQRWTPVRMTVRQHIKQYQNITISPWVWNSAIEVSKKEGSRNVKGPTAWWFERRLNWWKIIFWTQNKETEKYNHSLSIWLLTSFCSGRVSASLILMVLTWLVIKKYEWGWRHKITGRVVAGQEMSQSTRGRVVSAIQAAEGSDCAPLYHIVHNFPKIPHRQRRKRILSNLLCY